MEFRVRAATREDCRDVMRLVRELAVYEKMEDRVKISHEALERDGFCEIPVFHCFVAEVPEQHKTKEGYTLAGCVFYLYTYSTREGRSLNVESLYVMPEFRGKGIGKALVSNVAWAGKEHQCVCMDFSVLAWNTPTINLYLNKGAWDLTTSEGFHLFRFGGEEFNKLAEEAVKQQQCSHSS